MCCMLMEPETYQLFPSLYGFTHVCIYNLQNVISSVHEYIEDEEEAKIPECVPYSSIL